MQAFVGGGAAFAHTHLYICIRKSESNLKGCSTGVAHILFFKVSHSPRMASQRFLEGHPVLSPGDTGIPVCASSPSFIWGWVLEMELKVSC